MKRIAFIILFITVIFLFLPAVSVSAKTTGIYQSISAGGEHSFAIKDDGSLWAWGGNGCGQLGDGTYKDKSTPVKIMENVCSVSAGYNHSLAIKSDGTLWAWGNNLSGEIGNGKIGINNGVFTEYAQILKPEKIMDNVVFVYAGWGYSFAIKTDDTLWSWGGNKNIFIILRNILNLFASNYATNKIN